MEIIIAGIIDRTIKICEMKLLFTDWYDIIKHTFALRGYL
jgi:hypothetical protein